jgi:hypothetical protein
VETWLARARGLGAACRAGPRPLDLVPGRPSFRLPRLSGSVSHSSSSTRMVPPATWSPSLTCTARTVAS